MRMTSAVARAIVTTRAMTASVWPYPASQASWSLARCQESSGVASRSLSTAFFSMNRSSYVPYGFNFDPLDSSSLARLLGMGPIEKIQHVVALARSAGIEELSYLSVLLIVAKHPQISQIDLIATMQQTTDRGYSASALSHACRKMSNVARSGSPGLDLLTLEEDPDDLRRKQLSLTPRGQKLVARLTNEGL